MQPQNLFVQFATFLYPNIIFYIKSRLYSGLGLDFENTKIKSKQKRTTLESF